MTLQIRKAIEYFASGFLVLGLRNSLSILDFFFKYFLKLYNGHKVCGEPDGFKATTFIDSGVALALRFLYKKPGNTGRMACVSSSLMAGLKIACNSETLFPVANAKRNKVFSHKQSSDALAASYLGVDNKFNTFSGDQLGKWANWVAFLGNLL